jgi:hypothetical protein
MKMKKKMLKKKRLFQEKLLSGTGRKEQSFSSCPPRILEGWGAFFLLCHYRAEPLYV